MIKYTSAQNGIGYVNGNNGEILNAHLSYKGRSIIVDYEFTLHLYGGGMTRSKENKVVPFEMYPYGNDIYVGFVEVDERFGKADIAKLLQEVDKALEEEPEPYTPMEEDDE